MSLRDQYPDAPQSPDANGCLGLPGTLIPPPIINSAPPGNSPKGIIAASIAATAPAGAMGVALDSTTGVRQPIDWGAASSGAGHTFGDALLLQAESQQEELNGQHAKQRGQRGQQQLQGAQSNLALDGVRDVLSLSALGGETLHFDQSGTLGRGGFSSCFLETTTSDSSAATPGGGSSANASHASTSTGSTAEGQGKNLKITFDTLLYACQNGDDFLVTKWLETMGEKAACVLNDNPALLNRAVFGQHVKMVQMLLKANADPDADAQHVVNLARPFGGEQWPLRLAVQHGYTEICRLLLEHNACLEPAHGRLVGGMASIHTGEDDSGSLLGAAAFKGHVQIVQLLLDAQVPARSSNPPRFLSCRSVIVLLPCAFLRLM